MQLPTKKTAVVEDFAKMTTLIYGTTKIGKSTWCSHAPGALFLATEPGLSHLPVYQVPIETWGELIEACKEVHRGEHEFKTVVIDTIDNAYKMCTTHYCQKYNVEYENDGSLGYGKGRAMITNEFHRVLHRLARLPYGLILISHAMDKEYETRTGQKVKTIPTLPEKAHDVVIGMVDLVLFCDAEAYTTDEGARQYRRVMRTKPSPHYEAGDRSGRLPDTLPLDYKEFIKHFKPPRRRNGRTTSNGAGNDKTGGATK